MTVSCRSIWKRKTLTNSRLSPPLLNGHTYMVTVGPTMLGMCRVKTVLIWEPWMSSQAVHLSSTALGLASYTLFRVRPWQS